MSRKARYFLDQDNSCHWYLVNADHREEWDRWLDLDVDDEESWDAPEFAYRIGGNPSLIEFENPKVDGLPIDGTTKKKDPNRWCCPDCGSQESSKMGFAEAYTIECRKCGYEESGND